MTHSKARGPKMENPNILTMPLATVSFLVKIYVRWSYTQSCEMLVVTLKWACTLFLEEETKTQGWRWPAKDPVGSSKAEQRSRNQVTSPQASPPSRKEAVPTWLRSDGAPSPGNDNPWKQTPALPAWGLHGCTGPWRLHTRGGREPNPQTRQTPASEWYSINWCNSQPFPKAIEAAASIIRLRLNSSAPCKQDTLSAVAVNDLFKGEDAFVI